MLNVKIQFDKPNSDINDNQPNSSLVTNNINSSIEDDRPNSVTAHSFQATTVSTPSGISAGMPIGLLLALTYAGDPGPTIENFIGKSPNVTIKDY
ncbi:hypothetical protein M0R04_10965 [Candidatus Dojkabacteria bacterium]|jgi:hypothetical protein|nr:hypothetical protein [Candidatus Dojkabacteria bacterium]